MTQDVTTPDRLHTAIRARAREGSSAWGWIVALGALWICFGVFVLSYRVASLVAVVTVVGVSFLISGFTELIAAPRLLALRWLSVVGGRGVGDQPRSDRDLRRLRAAPGPQAHRTTRRLTRRQTRPEQAPRATRPGPREGVDVRASHPEAANPVLLQHLRERNQRRENRVADQITRFAGSMRFVYIHLVWFGAWIVFRVEAYPFGLLTMIVSLEAIFLSTFVMISQNRADEKRQVLADNQWKIVQYEEAQNDQLIELTKQILELTKAIHSVATTLQGQGGQGQSGS